MKIAALKPLCPALWLCFFAAAGIVPAHACGWWGDGEMGRHSASSSTAAGDSRTDTRLDMKNAKLPGREGYGLAVTGPGLAVPYLQATNGRAPIRISELKTFGFAAVIDLGTPKETARLHEAETRAAGMRYMSIPVDANIPGRRQTRLFNQMIARTDGAPLLVYAPSAPLLAYFWAAHRLSLGAPLAFAIRQGRSLGLTPEQETALRKRALAGML